MGLDIYEHAEAAEETAKASDVVLDFVQLRFSVILGKSSGYIKGLSDGAERLSRSHKAYKQSRASCRIDASAESQALKRSTIRVLTVLAFLYILTFFTHLSLYALL